MQYILKHRGIPRPEQPSGSFSRPEQPSGSLSRPEQSSGSLPRPEQPNGSILTGEELCGLLCGGLSQLFYTSYWLPLLLQAGLEPSLLLHPASNMEKTHLLAYGIHRACFLYL